MLTLNIYGMLTDAEEKRRESALRSMTSIVWKNAVAMYVMGVCTECGPAWKFLFFFGGGGFAVHEPRWDILYHALATLRHTLSYMSHAMIYFIRHEPPYDILYHTRATL